jgi:hypothetical protein
LSVGGGRWGLERRAKSVTEPGVVHGSGGTAVASDNGLRRAVVAEGGCVEIRVCGLLWGRCRQSSLGYRGGSGATGGSTVGGGTTG